MKADETRREVLQVWKQKLFERELARQKVATRSNYYGRHEAWLEQEWAKALEYERALAAPL
jgi:hypothetical protein